MLIEIVVSSISPLVFYSLTHLDLLSMARSCKALQHLLYADTVERIIKLKFYVQLSSLPDGVYRQAIRSNDLLQILRMPLTKKQPENSRNLRIHYREIGNGGKSSLLIHLESLVVVIKHGSLPRLFLHKDDIFRRQNPMTVADVI
jgi:hypothetical protein